MPIRIVRLGSARAPGEGLRLGTVRRPPRGVKKGDYARRNYYDAWLPELAPSAAACHRSLLAGLLEDAGGVMARTNPDKEERP